MTGYENHRTKTDWIQSGGMFGMGAFCYPVDRA
jgi:hypothetical protein